MIIQRHWMIWSTITSVILKLPKWQHKDYDWEYKDKTKKVLGWNQHLQSSNVTRKWEKKVKLGVLLKINRLIFLQHFMDQFSLA